MRVLYIENAIGFGGSLTGLLDFIRSLPTEVEPILASSFDVRPFVKLPDDLPYENLNLPQPPPSTGNVLRGLLTMYRHNFKPWRTAIERLATKYRPDVIHTNNGLLINIGAALAGQRLGIPVIGYQKCVEYSGRLNGILAKRGWYAHHIPSSQPIAEILLNLGVPQSKVTVIYEPIYPPAEPFIPRYDRPLDSNRPVQIGMCSMLTSWKGQDVFLRAIAGLRKRTGQAFEVVLAGSAPDGDADFPAMLKRLATELGVADLVRFHGHVRDMYGFLPELDISVHASVRPEPFGRIVAESMICGLPVVATKAGGPGDYVHDGEFGFTVPMGNAEAMAEALQKLLESRELQQTIGRAGRAFALENFNPSTIVEQNLKIYRASIEA